jgi:hypothetical protein
VNTVESVVALVEAWGRAHYDVALDGARINPDTRVDGEGFADMMKRLPTLAGEAVGVQGALGFVRLVPAVFDAQSALGQAHRRADERQSYQAGVAVGRAEVRLEVAEAALRESARLAAAAVPGPV